MPPGAGGEAQPPAGGDAQPPGGGGLPPLLWGGVQPPPTGGRERASPTTPFDLIDRGSTRLIVLGDPEKELRGPSERNENRALAALPYSSMGPVLRTSPPYRGMGVISWSTG